MIRILIIGLILLLYACDKNSQSLVKENKDTPQEISFYTPDSIMIFGDLYEFDKTFTTILLFHQAGSNSRGEYVSILPILLEKGYNLLAIDQRVGGQLYGNYNRTIANIPDNSFDNNYTYCDAYNNLTGALDFIIDSGFTGKKILWGSSYSGALAIQVAAKRGNDVAGVLAFSPSSGNSVEACKPDLFFEDVKVPLLVLRPPHEMERESVQQQFEVAVQHGHETYAATAGVHGSSMLVAERVNGDVEPNWKVVMSFISKVGE